MSDQPGPPNQPRPSATLRAQASRRWRFSLIWMIPIVTALLGAWLAYDTLSKRGPLITITFQGAEGIVAGQSRVRHKDVEMGAVETVALTPDLQRVVMTIRMNREATPLLTDKAQFWVVKPRFFAGAVSGLETLLSGSYIELLPAGSGGAPKRDFVGLEDPPVLESDVPGHTFLLHASRIGNLSLGSPVYYRDFTVGEVLGWDIGDMADSVTVHAFVRAPFDRYVHDGSRFWNASGLSLSFGASGIQLQLESLRALVLGGIAFDTSAEARDTPVSAEQHGFPLYADKKEADEASYTRRIPCLAYFDGAVAGLAPGSAVTLHGIHIGEVDRVNLEYDPTLDRVVVPVHFMVEPQRIANFPELTDTNLKPVMTELVHRGMRVRLETASLITGSKQLTLNYEPHAPAAELRMAGNDFVIPTLTTGGDDLASSATAIMEKLNTIPFKQIGDNLNDTLKGMNDIANSQQLKQSLASLQTTLAGIQDLVRRTSSGLDPVLQRLPALAKELEDTVRGINKLVGSADAGYGGNSQFNRDADRLLVQLTDTARSVRVLSDLLTRHPEALLRGRTDQGP